MSELPGHLAGTRSPIAWKWAEKHVEPEHIRMLMACAEICDTSARFMLLGSRHHARTCEVRADVCEACAEDCDQFEDDLMTRCADVCRYSAESCRELAGTRSRV